jgi:hypothetical protein
MRRFQLGLALAAMGLLAGGWRILSVCERVRQLT